MTNDSHRLYDFPGKWHAMRNRTLKIIAYIFTLYVMLSQWPIPFISIEYVNCLDGKSSENHQCASFPLPTNFLFVIFSFSLSNFPFIFYFWNETWTNFLGIMEMTVWSECAYNITTTDGLCDRKKERLQPPNCLKSDKTKLIWMQVHMKLWW